MKTELLTLSKIFSESLYRIPDYQRGYSWEKEQINDFWLDLEQLSQGTKHYTGVITLEEVDEAIWKTWLDDLWIIESRSFQPFYVVDGQQRLTTVIILIQSILERCTSLNHLNFTPIADIRRRYIFDSKPEDLARSYLFGYEKDNPSYEFLKRKIFLEESDIHHPKEETIYTKNLLFAKEFFANKLNEMDDKSVEILYTKVTQQLVFNAYEISSDIDVFVAFETMNNRGKLLSTLELLKNRLIFLSTKLPVPHGADDKLRRAINDAWKSAYHYLGKNKKRPLNDENYLMAFLSFYYIKNIEIFQNNDDDETIRKRRRFYRNIENFSRFLLHELFSQKRLAEKKSVKTSLPTLTHNYIYEFSSQIKSTVELYYNLSSPEDTDYSDEEKIWLSRIGRLEGYYPSGLLLAIYSIEKKTNIRINALKAMEKFTFLSSLSGIIPRIAYRGRRNDFNYLIEYISNHMNTIELTEKFSESTQKILSDRPITDLIHDYIKSSQGYYGWHFIRYFLYEYELDLKNRSKAAREKIDWDEFSREIFEEDYTSIEHIYPQTARDPYWTKLYSKYTATQKKYLRNSLGNLAALSKPRNSALSNRPFPEKISRELTGYRYGSYSENELTKFENWGPEEILERGIKMLNFLEERWELSLGSQENKTRALGLEFLIG